MTTETDDQKSNGALLPAEEKRPPRGRFLELAENLRISIPHDTDILKDNILSLANNRIRDTIASGIFCQELKERAGRGEYHKWLDEVGIPKQRASEDIRITKLLERVPEEKRALLFSFGKKKLIELCKIDNEVLDYTLDSDKEDLIGMSVKELKADIDSKTSEIYKLKTQLETSQYETKKARSKRNYTEIADESRMPMHVVRARVESSHYQVQASVAISDIENQWHEYSSEHESSDTDNAAQVNQAYYYAMVQIFEHAREALGNMQAQANPDYIHAFPLSSNLVERDSEEYKEVKKAAKEIIEEHLYQKQMRANKIANDFKQGAGRKFKEAD